MKLYEIASEIEAALTATDDGELTPDAESRLDSLELALEEKADNVAAVIRTAIGEANAYAAEIDRLRKLQATANGRAERLKTYLHDCLTRAGMTRLKGPRFSLSVCRNSQPAVAVEDASALPDALKTVVTTITPNRSAILDAHKAGQELPPGVTITTGTHLRIN